MKSFKIIFKFEINENKQKLSPFLKIIKDEHFDLFKILTNIEHFATINNSAIFNIIQSF